MRGRCAIRGDDLKCNSGLPCYDLAMSRSTPLRVLLPVALAALVLVLAGLFYWQAPVPLVEAPSVSTAGTAVSSNTGNERNATGKASGRAEGSEPGVFSPPGNAEERRQALIRAVAAVHGRQAAALLSQALRDPDLAVRQEALQLSAQLAEAEVDQAVLPMAMQDEDPRVRDLATHRVNELEVARRIEFFAGALQGARDDAAMKAAEWLGVLGGKAAAEALVSAWPRLSGGPRVPALRRALERLAGRPLANAQEAQAWWSQEAAGLDEDLLQKPR